MYYRIEFDNGDQRYNSVDATENELDHFSDETLKGRAKAYLIHRFGKIARNWAVTGVYADNEGAKNE